MQIDIVAQGIGLVDFFAHPRPVMSRSSSQFSTSANNELLQLLQRSAIDASMADAHARRQCIQQERKKRRETCANAHEEVPKRMLAILTDTSHLAP
ncbi:hypothetical protein OUZ56_004650 [Daphnia magna]|uniref:Uncharacterized protein n=1 Tax=Daphnia magna TaxID=35525 RepID=A0ABQ9YQF3_9CRUS|nr:hypothetical protein OUZ56_004650 [Daphnia magna]